MVEWLRKLFKKKQKKVWDQNTGFAHYVDDHNRYFSPVTKKAPEPFKGVIRRQIPPEVNKQPVEAPSIIPALILGELIDHETFQTQTTQVLPSPPTDSYVGGGGLFDGAGASGDWSDRDISISDLDVSSNDSVLSDSSSESSSVSMGSDD